MFLKLLREGLGRLVILISFFIPLSNKQKRDAQQQACADRATQSLSLYQFYACPFCLKARRAIKRLNLKIETRDAQKNPGRSELNAGGGQIKVPCLRIDEAGETRWLYESDDIIAYLEKRFGENSSPCDELANETTAKS
ncbi:MAG TPA: glutathione S-transferase N-terminal domain-containing protein [Gammaproteobacteria bacterium]